MARLTEEQRNIGSRKRAYIAMEQAQTTNYLEREAGHKQYRVETEQALAGGRRNRAITGQVASTATPSSDSGIIMTTLFVIAGLVVMYILVTNTATSGWLGSLGTGIHALSSNKPLFTATAK